MHDDRGAAATQRLEQAVRQRRAVLDAVTASAGRRTGAFEGCDGHGDRFQPRRVHRARPAGCAERGDRGGETVGVERPHPINLVNHELDRSGHNPALDARRHLPWRGGPPRGQGVAGAAHDHDALAQHTAADQGRQGGESGHVVLRPGVAQRGDAQGVPAAAERVHLGVQFVGRVAAAGEGGGATEEEAGGNAVAVALDAPAGRVGRGAVDAAPAQRGGAEDHSVPAAVPQSHRAPGGGGKLVRGGMTSLDQVVLVIACRLHPGIPWQ